MVTELQVELETACLNQVSYRCSPNCNVRPADCEPELIVLHNISLPPGKFGGPHIDALFMNQLDPGEHEYFAGIADLQVSAHILIRRNGEVIQYVPFHLRAWHAGVSSYNGRENCNDFSIGIELEGSDNVPYAEAQYQSLNHVIRALLNTYKKLSPARITSHSHIAPGRKTDPGPAFDWAYFHALIEQ